MPHCTSNSTPNGAEIKIFFLHFLKVKKQTIQTLDANVGEFLYNLGVGSL